MTKNLLMALAILTGCAWYCYYRRLSVEPIAFLSSVVSAILKGIVEKAAFGSSDRSKRFIALYSVLLPRIRSI